MADISTEQVKALRDKTGVSIMQCRKALEETGGDMDKAEILLRKRGAEAAHKKAGRTLGAGAVVSYVHNNQIGALVLLSCETDFVAKNEEFVALAQRIAQQVAATSPVYKTVADIPEEVRAKAAETFQAELKGKPAEMHEKILAGKLSSYFKDQVLVEQDDIRDPSMTIRGHIEAAIQKFGERIEVGDIARFSARG